MALWRPVSDILLFWLQPIWTLLSSLCLHLSTPPPSFKTGLDGLGHLQQLTSLSINAASYIISDSSTPGFSKLTALQYLSVRDSKEFNPIVLQNMRALRVLRIVDTAINPRGVPPHLAVGIATLLAVLPNMQQLTHLDLTECLNWPNPPQAYSALTASTKLEALIVRCGHFPDDICRYMFPEHHVLPHLKQLVLNSNWPHNVALDAGDVARLARSCPAIQHLDVDFGRQSADRLLHLTQLTALTLLTAADVGDEALGSLALLTTLRQLDIERPQELTPLGLLKLTALTGLTQLLVAASHPGPTSARFFGAQGYNRAVFLRSRPVSSDWWMMDALSKRFWGCLL